MAYGQQADDEWRGGDLLALGSLRHANADLRSLGYLLSMQIAN